MTDHVDRNPQKQLLRGTAGYIHSWVLGKNDNSKDDNGVRSLQKVPDVVFVKFFSEEGKELEWKSPELHEKGLYPITPKKKVIGFLIKAEGILYSKFQDDRYF